MKFEIANTFTDELPADPDLTNTPRQVEAAAYSFVEPRKPTDPKIVHVSSEAAEMLGIGIGELNSENFLNTFSGGRQIENSKSYAMCYGGHQFGSWAGQLGDGRAINLGQVSFKDDSYALQLKGSGQTPYSRGADGLAVLRSSVREHLCSEAMFHLGVPTTRSLSLILTGDDVLRDISYDGNPAYEKGAVVCRVAPSFIRFGNFEIFASRGDIKNLRALTNHTIKHYFSDTYAALNSIEFTKQNYIDFFREVAKRTLTMVIHWQRVGFVHGVMNTDNMSILGLTIDYGPYGWLEPYDSGWTPNTTDRQYKRYRFGNQPQVALWNLLQLANALVSLTEDPEPFEEILSEFGVDFKNRYQIMMQNKLGLFNFQKNDDVIIEDLLELLEKTEVDMTIFFRSLSGFIKQDFETETDSGFVELKKSFYDPNAFEGDVKVAWKQWLDNYFIRLEAEKISDAERSDRMNLVNPKYVLRNYMAQLAIDAADGGDYSVIEELYELLKHPYSEQNESNKWFAKRPEWARNKVGCSMLSCSS